MNDRSVIYNIFALLNNQEFVYTSTYLTERMELVFRPVFKTGSRRIKPAVAGSIPALSAILQPMIPHKNNYE